jgi:enoyl-CoA hydratase
MVEFERDGHVALITLNRPEARNAVNGAVAQGIESALDTFEADDGLWVAVLRSSGTVFCAGADLKEIAAGNANLLSTKRGGFGGLVKRERTKPLIAAVHGAAVAGGCELCLACDLIVAVPEASFGLPEVKRSLVAAAGGLFRLPRAVGKAAAMEMILTGDPISAERAYELGLVNKIVAADQLMAEAMALAGRITANAPLAVASSRELASRALTDDDETLWKDSAKAISDILKTEDAQEGPRAFVEKRAPVWKGR